MKVKKSTRSFWYLIAAVCFYIVAIMDFYTGQHALAVTFFALATAQLLLGLMSYKQSSRDEEE